MSSPINIKLTVEQEQTLKSMGSMSITGKVIIDLQTGEQNETHKPKTYWFMPCVFEETNDPLVYMVHELPILISKQIANFIRE